MASFFGFGATPKLAVRFDDEDLRPTVPVRVDGDKTEELFLYSSFDDVKGRVMVEVPSGKKVEHLGIKCELIGQVELAHDRGNHYVFSSLVRELEPPGELNQNKEYPFEFCNVEKQHETYRGINVKLRYFIRVKITRQYAPNVVKEVDFAVQNLHKEPTVNQSIKMEVGIEDCLHIEFEYNKAKYHLNDVVVGKIYFLLVRIKIKHMELQILRREATGTGPNQV
jgi:vacuolar protein sorting-associated protein 26